MNYLVVYDYASGSKDRYHVFVLTADDPVRIGCELPMKDIPGLIKRYEQAADYIGFFGDRDTVFEIMNKVNKRC